MSDVSAIGVDAGSTTCKLVAVDANGKLIDHLIEPTQPRLEDQVARLLGQMKEKHGANGVPTVATGYGRKLIKTADRNITEITCHARGVFADLKKEGTLVDIGGQDSKVIRVGPGGKAVDFMMNDKCAAGTGRFLEHTASRLEVPIDQLGVRANAAPTEESISSTCTVFAESEIISLIAHGADLEAILKGLHRSLVSRINSMVNNVGVVPPLMLSGGVAQNEGVRAMLSESTGQPVLLPSHPQLMGAYGAAIIGLG